MIFRLGENKLIALLKDTLNEEINEASEQNESASLFENYDKENLLLDAIESEGKEMYFNEVEVSNFYNDEFSN